jgi:hypothetical protein
MWPQTGSKCRQPWLANSQRQTSQSKDRPARLGLALSHGGQLAVHELGQHIHVLSACE